MTRPVEIAAQGGLRAVEAGGAATEAGAEVATRGSRQVKDAPGQAVQQTAAAARRYHAAASQLLTAEGGFAGFWLELVREQVTHNAETFRKLTATRDWREAVEAAGHAGARQLRADGPAERPLPRDRPGGAEGGRLGRHDGTDQAA